MEGAELAHDQRIALKGDLERIRHFVELEFDRDGARGLAVFAAGLDNFWSPLALTAPVADAVKVNDELYLTPLVPLVGRGEGAVVAVVGRERGDLYRLRAGRLEELVDRTEQQPGRHDQGGWSQARYQRHIENLVANHLRRVADELDRLVRRRPAPIVVVSSEETRAEFLDLLSKEVRKAIVGWTTAEAHAGPAELLGPATELLERRNAERETEALERWREETGRSGRAASGWSASLEAASDGRIEVLLYQQGAEHDAWRCPACGRLSLEHGTCPLDGTELEHRAEGLDLAIHQTLAHGGSVLAATHRSDLEPVAGIGALLRF
jgi:peptide chain release factor subunit 1